MDLGHSLVSQTSPLYQTYCWYVESVVFSATEIISNGRDRASDPQNWTAFFSFTIILHSLRLTTDNADGIDCVSVCFLCLSETLVGSGGSTDGFFARKPALKRLALAVRRTGDACRLSQDLPVKEPSVDPTRRVNMSVFARKSSLWIGAQICENTTINSAVAEGPRDASCQLKSCQLPSNSAENTCTTSPEQIEVMKLEG